MRLGSIQLKNRTGFPRKFHQKYSKRFEETSMHRQRFTNISRTAGPVDDFGVINVTSAHSAHNQLVRVCIEAVVGDSVAANRMKCLGAHLAKLAFGDVEEIGSERDGVRAEIGRVVGRIVGDDKTLIDEIVVVDTALDWWRPGGDCTLQRSSPFRLRFGILRRKETDGIRIIVVVQGERRSV